MTERGHWMDQQQRTKRFGIYVILCAVLLRLTAAGLPEKIMAWLTDANTAPFLIYLETGRNVRFSDSSKGFSDFFRESPAPWISEAEKPCFTAGDAEAVEVYYACSRRPDLGALMEKPLDWDLTGEAPTVLILHTHTTESYTRIDEDYVESSDYRTLDEGYNMLSIGDAVAEILAENGIGVIHDRELHDYPSYNGSYVHARRSIRAYLEEYPSIRLVLDLHRDAAGTVGSQLRTEALVDGEVSAQLMLVMGTDASGQDHENWEENLSLALKLQTQLERLSPGITRPLSLRAQRFNQDLSPGALLVEVGAAGNTHKEALIAARKLADAVVSLARGTETK